MQAPSPASGVSKDSKDPKDAAAKAATATPAESSGGASAPAGGGGASELAGMKLGTLNLSVLETVSSQKNLQVLDLKDSKIAAVPGEVYRAFAQAKVLDLRKNTLEEILPDISAMTALEDLLVDQNRLHEIPKEICGLPKLKTLSLSQNLLSSLPKEIGNMAALRSLSLGDNHLAEIPQELGKCKELQTLYLHHNHFTKLPTSLHQLESLTELALEWFRYTTPPLPRVIKGAEWKRIIVKFMNVCKEKADKGLDHVTCIETLSQFSQKTFDANAIDSKRRTRLHVACLEGHVGVATSLAENGSKCDSLDCEGYSPLLVAVREEHPDIATALVRVGVDVNRGGGLFGSPLHVGTVNFDPHMVLLLIRGRADVNQTDGDGNTPLHVLMSVFDKGGKRAGAIGHILLKHSADCNMMNSDKWAPLHLAARRGQVRGICFVLTHSDSVDGACLKGTCQHVAAAAGTKKAKSSRVRTCARVFDLNLRGGSHLWTPLHLAGHACHVPVVQILIEAGADVFLRNVDGRTARHVSRGNLAISKLLRKAEDEWLWYRIHQDQRDPSPTEPSPLAPPAGIGDVDGLAGTSSSKPDEGFLESLRLDDDDDDRIDEIAKNLELTEADGPLELGGAPQRRPGRPGETSKMRDRFTVSTMRDRIMEKCLETNLGKQELQQLQAANFRTPSASFEEFLALFEKMTQQGPKQRLPFLLAQPWVKDMMRQMLEDERAHAMLLHGSLVSNEDCFRMLVAALPKDKLHLFGVLRNSEQESLLHVLCKGNSTRAYPSLASRADLLCYFLTVCPPETFELEARDHRGQTALHLAAQSGDIGLVQVLLEYGSDPNAQEETTGWTPLHFAVAKAHYPLILQLLHHDATNVNQADKFDWPPLLEACSRLDARSTSLLVNGGAHLGFRNQHQFDALKAVDTSKKDLAAKRWMSCLVVSNGFRFEESTVRLNAEDRETLVREKNFFDSRQVPSTHPPFYVPDHLAPRCHSCKVLYSVTVRRYHCRSCGLVLCGDCYKWRGTNIVALDERLKSRQLFAQAPLSCFEDQEGLPLSEVRLTSAVEMSIRERGGNKPAQISPTAPLAPVTRQAPRAPSPEVPASATGAPGAEPPASARSDDSFEDPPLAEELPAVGPPMSLVCPASMSQQEPHDSRRAMPSAKPVQGGLSRDRRSASRASLAAPAGAPQVAASRTVRLCSSCTVFFEVGVGETYVMLARKEALHAGSQQPG